MHLCRIACLALGIALSSTSAMACERDPFAFKLPGETDAEAQARTSRIADDQFIANRFNREAHNLDKATYAYLARVVSRNRSTNAPDKWTPPSTIVRPLAMLKGASQRLDRILVDGGSGLCDDRGDGFGAHASEGTLVVVFEGLPITAERPRGIDSLLADDIRTVPMLSALMGLYGPEEQ